MYVCRFGCKYKLMQPHSQGQQGVGGRGGEGGW